MHTQDSSSISENLAAQTRRRVDTSSIFTSSLFQNSKISPDAQWERLRAWARCSGERKARSKIHLKSLFVARMAIRCCSFYHATNVELSAPHRALKSRLSGRTDGYQTSLTYLMQKSAQTFAVAGRVTCLSRCV